ncbi:carboxypeptidase regulatory-like domain-containing protein [Rhodopirellula sallentina]|uniref:Peptidase M56, BlaR1 n=1 Tax=Rhodopirellula sallentina SM41 TaxID=1263870 RepID=M5U1D1_9BACT|nr:carboxypeptidase regulatory-like domain-containing protein [Rhodopirellula sallentina]EMI55252.1 peptidase M56, BlaR1 [Rhodopirellula sallentina SM41]
MMLKLPGLGFWLVAVSSCLACLAQDEEPDVLNESVFEVRFVQSDDQPIANVPVDVRRPLDINAGDVIVGTLVQKKKFTTKLLSNEKGILRLPMQCFPENFELMIHMEGYAPYFARFDREQEGDSLLEPITLRLESAWTVGGRVVDAGGQPVVGADVRPSFPLSLRPGDPQPIHNGWSVSTDADGRWIYALVPESKQDVGVSINHADFQPLRLTLSRAKYEVTETRSADQKITLPNGFILAGMVTDEAGKPMPGANVRTKFHNEVRETTTDEYGRYQLAGCEPGLTRLVVHAEGKALEMKEVRIGPEMEMQDFVLRPGGRVRVRVVDQQGKGIAKTHIFLQRWRGRVDYFEFDHVDTYTNEDGIWIWDEAPLDAFQADICPPGGMQLTKQTILAGEDELVFEPPNLLVVSGTVSDAETGEPITHYRVTPGLVNERYQNGINWNDRQRFSSQSDHYEVTFNRTGDGHAVRIEADSYRIAQSRVFASDEGAVNYDFQLIRATNLEGRIVSPDGRSVSGAQIAIGDPNTQITIKEGRFRDSSTYATRLVADEEGKFSVPARDDDFYLVILHEEGHAFIKSTQLETNRDVRLIPWASVRGSYRVGSEPGSDIPLVVGSGNFSPGDRLAGRIYAESSAMTDAEGRYHVKHLFAGRCAIARDIVMMVDDGATEVASSIRIPFDIDPGEQMELPIGGSGRAVVGTLFPPIETKQANASDSDVDWKFANVYVDEDIVAPPPPVDQQALRQNPGQWQAWLESPVGQAWRASMQAYQAQRSRVPRYRATVASNGRFRIEDMPAGRYRLSVRTFDQSGFSLSNHRFKVPPIETSGNKNSSPAEPFDLGELFLQRR